MTKKLKAEVSELEDDEGLSAPALERDEKTLRPKVLSEYVGQEKVVSQLRLFLEAARARKAPLDHVLLSGPPGLGKTTLAHIIAQEMGTRLVMAPAPSLSRSADLLGILSDLQEGDVLFVDEIHRLSLVVEEGLYPAMEDFRVQMLLGEGAQSQSINIDLQRFTLVGATTQPGKISNPLRDRFGIPLQLDFYSEAELEKVLHRSGGIWGFPLHESALRQIAQRSRGTPRIANRLLARVRDYLEVQRSRAILDQRVAPSSENELRWVTEAFQLLGVDELGFQEMDRRYLKVLLTAFKGGPAGLSALASSLSEDTSTLEETIEPFLLKRGFIVRTPKGRMATDLSWQHMGLDVPPKSQELLL